MAQRDEIRWKDWIDNKWKSKRLEKKKIELNFRQN